MRKDASSSNKSSKRQWITESKRSWNGSEYDKAALAGNVAEWESLFQSVGGGRPENYIYRPPSRADIERELREQEEAREMWQNPNATQAERRWAAETLGYMVYIPPSPEEMEAQNREIAELERISRDQTIDEEARLAAEERIRAIQGIVLY